MDDLKLYGGPGSGKTESGLRWTIERVEDGADVHGVAFVSYTNAAVDEAKSRVAETFGISDPDKELPYSRTLHSLCYRALGISGQDWNAEQRIKDFGQQYGYDVAATRRSADEEGVEGIRDAAGRDAVMLAVWEFGRQRLITHPYEAYRAFQEYDPDGTALIGFPRFKQFVSDYEEWKHKGCLRDYTDLLLELLERPVSLPVSVAVIDEAQDLSPLMWAAADILFADAPLRAVLGDDDQAIYSFGGADPLLMNKRPARQVVKLTQSHRLPRTVCEAAHGIISQNDNREPKDLQPRDYEGSAASAYDLSELPLSAGSWFLLVRNWRLKEQFTDWLEAHGLPYRIAGNRYSPWSERGPRQAAAAILTLSQGGIVSLGDLAALAKKTPAGNSKKTGAWVYGAKTTLEEKAADRPSREVSWRDLFRYGMTEEGFTRVMRGDLTLLEKHISDRDLRTYAAAQRAGTWAQPVRVTVGSIHSVKGRQADNVAVLAGCTAAPARGMLWPWRAEEERRVGYVGITRARERFYSLKAWPDDGVFPWNVCAV